MLIVLIEIVKIVMTIKLKIVEMKKRKLLVNEVDDINKTNHDKTYNDKAGNGKKRNNKSLINDDCRKNNDNNNDYKMKND